MQYTSPRKKKKSTIYFNKTTLPEGIIILKGSFIINKNGCKVKMARTIKLKFNSTKEKNLKQRKNIGEWSEKERKTTSAFPPTKVIADVPAAYAPGV